MLISHRLSEIEQRLDFSRRVEISGKDEIAQTARSFNQLPASVQQQVAQSVADGAERQSDASSGMRPRSNSFLTASAMSATARARRCRARSRPAATPAKAAPSSRARSRK